MHTRTRVRNARARTRVERNKMLHLEIIRTQDKDPRWTINILKYNEIGWYEKKIIEDIAMLLEEKNHEIDEEKENDTLPFN